MATPPDQPWSNHEKNYLLAEIIKASNPPPEVLFNIIRQHNILPRWEDIPLPPGRSLNSSRIAFEDLRRSLSMHAMAAPMAPLTPTPISAQPATQTIKRPFPFESQYAVPGGGGGREIRPKPIQSGPSLYAQPSPTEPPPKRKRGRPTKAESLAKREAAGAAGPVETGPAPAPRPLPPPIQTPSSTTSSVPTLAAPAPEEPKPPSLPPATRMPIAAMLTPTAREPKSASQSSSSSGKRRRARSTKSEAEETTPVGRSGQRYESPYARMGPGSEDSPARTAVLRHREDPATSSATRTAPPERPAEAHPHASGVRSQETTIRTRPLPHSNQ